MNLKGYGEEEFMRQRLDTLDVGVYERGCLHGVDKLGNHEGQGRARCMTSWEVQPTPRSEKMGTEHSQYKPMVLGCLQSLHQVEVVRGMNVHPPLPLTAG